MKHRMTTMPLALLMIILVASLFGCGSNAASEESDVIREYLIQLQSSQNMLDQIDPFWNQQDIDAYFGPELQDATNLKNHINAGKAAYQQIIDTWQDRTPIPENVDDATLEKAWEELFNLRQTLLFEANYLKTGLDLMEKDLNEGNNSSKSIVSQVNAYFADRMQSVWGREFHRINLKYNLGLSE